MDPPAIGALSRREPWEREGTAGRVVGMEYVGTEVKFLTNDLAAVRGLSSAVTTPRGRVHPAFAVGATTSYVSSLSG
jgi:hypothetical protein